ncbi:hypothetical protein COLO4_31023 [Corchorus olitorius]|uniref:Uncharacterized protein n=1 Tax=Corchorus olitorius TaxID=93759 RepID=A0A1R3H671_9ROSI|nr:hypothetical protein COLO4_31023 [Corchorus olitorius]
MADVFSLTTLHETVLCPPKPKTNRALTPFSAVVPARFMAVARARLNINITLETILEEENEEEIMDQVSQNTLSTTTFLSTCFLEVKNTLPSYNHNCKCAF